MPDAPPPSWDQPGGWGQDRPGQDRPAQDRPSSRPGPPAPPPGWTQQPGQPAWGQAAPAGYQPPPSGYVAYNPYGAGAVRDHPNGTTILVLGILSLVICGLLGPIAWSMGNKAIREIDSDTMSTYSNRGNVNAGRICGIISSCLLIVAVIVIVIAIAAAAGSS